MQGEIRRVAGVADSATDGMELPRQRAKTGLAGDPGLAARRRWVEENPLKPKPGLSGPPVQVSQKVISKTSERPVCPRVSNDCDKVGPRLSNSRRISKIPNLNHRLRELNSAIENSGFVPLLIL